MGLKKGNCFWRVPIDAIRKSFATAMLTVPFIAFYNKRSTAE